MLQVQPLELTDFSGGITDHIYRPDPTKSQELDNFVVLPNKSILTRFGSVVDVTTTADDQIPAGNQRIGTLINYDTNTKLFIQSAKKLYYRNPTAYATLQGSSGNDVFSAGSTSSIISHSQWNKHLFVTSDAFPRPMKIYKDSAGVYKVRTAGLPALATAPVITVGTASTKNYLYAFHYKYTYVVGASGQTFIDAGPIYYVEVVNSSEPSVSANGIASIPVLANGVTDNWDTANITIEIFRSIDGGDTMYNIGHVTNGTTTYSDSKSDATIQDTGTLMYTMDGSVDNDPPPLHKFFHIVNGCGYYGYLKEGSEEKPFSLRQSVPGDIDSVPVDFEDMMEDEMKGLSSVKNVPIVLCKRHIYRVDGQFDQFGKGGMTHVRLSDTAGCVSNQSCVQAEDGLFWAGNDGFYFTDGYIVQKISDDNNDRYQEMIAASSDVKRIVGKFDERNRRIIWTVQTDSASLDNDSCWVLDLRWGIRPASTFTTWNHIVLSASFAPTSIEFFNGDLYRADKRGYVFIHKEDYTTDPLVNASADCQDWGTETIIHDWTSIAFNGGSTFKRKIATRCLLTAKNRTNVSIQIQAINDDGKIIRDLKEIRWRRNFIWGDDEFVWDNPDCIWRAEGLIEQWRRLPARGLRWSYIQLRVTNAYTTITNSDTLGTATFAAVGNTALLDDATNADWPTKSIGYDLLTEADNYEKTFSVTSRTADTLTLLDPQNVLPNGSLKWLMKGYPKGEVLNLLGINLHWAPLSPSQLTFESGQDGTNA